jgi:hypothetical protein
MAIELEINLEINFKNSKLNDVKNCFAFFDHFPHEFLKKVFAYTDMYTDNFIYDFLEHIKKSAYLGIQLLT